MKKIVSFVCCLTIVFSLIPPMRSQAVVAEAVVVYGAEALMTACGLALVGAGAGVQNKLQIPDDGNSIAALGWNFKKRLDLAKAAGTALSNDISSWYDYIEKQWKDVQVSASSLMHVPGSIMAEAKKYLQELFSDQSVASKNLSWDGEAGASYPTASLSGRSFPVVDVDSNGKPVSGKPFVPPFKYDQDSPAVEIKIGTATYKYQYVHGVSPYDSTKYGGDGKSWCNGYPSAGWGMSFVSQINNIPRWGVEWSFVIIRNAGKAYFSVVQRSFLGNSDSFGDWHIAAPSRDVVRLLDSLGDITAPVPIDDGIYGHKHDVDVIPNYDFINGVSTYPRTAVDSYPGTDQAAAGAIDVPLNPAQSLARGEVGTLTTADLVNAIPSDVVLDKDIVLPSGSESTQDNLNKMKAPNVILTKFPFCIPWDLYNAVSMLAVPAETPKFEIPIQYDKLNINTSLVIDFQQFDTLAAICRWFLSALFLLMLILITRTLIRG